MRSTTAEQLAQLGDDNRSTHMRVFIDRTGSGDFADLTDQGGVDWVNSVEIDHNVDAIASTCNIKLRREAGAHSISALMTGAPLNNLPGSYKALVDIGREIYVEVCVLPELATPESGDWVEVFRGIVDDLDLGGKEIQMRCRDQAYLLLDTYIESLEIYGSSSGADVEDVIQSILDDHLGSGVVDLYSPNGTAGTPFNSSDSPGFAILEYEQQQSTVAEAIDALVRQFGWVVRYAWHANTSAYQLVLYEPDRTKTTPDHTFGADDYYDIKRLSLSRMGIRNRIQVDYTDASTGLRKSVLATDSTSISRYGTLYMKIGEGESSQIDSSTEATALAQAVRDDLKDPDAEQETEQGLFWPAELGDLYRYSANGVHYDSDQDLALVGIRHVFANGFGRSSFSVRGSPSGGYRRWLRLDSRDMVALGYGDMPEARLNDSTGEEDNLLFNGDFGAQSRDVESYLPDGWWPNSPSLLTYGSSGDVYYSTTQLSGLKSVKFIDKSRGDIEYSKIRLKLVFPVVGGDTYRMIAEFQTVFASYLGVCAYMEIDWLDASRSYISTSQLGLAPSLSGSWESASVDRAAPSTARYGQVVLYRTAAAYSYVLVDLVKVRHL